MGTLMDNNMFETLISRTFVYDLEYVGVPNNLERCFIWEIGAIHLATGRQFSIAIDPGIRPLPPPMSAEFVHVTELFLRQKNAVTFNYAWDMFRNWIQSFGNGNALLISHNNFKSDKPLIEIEMKRRQLQMPIQWYFFDSLLYCRQVIPKQPSYTLSDLYLNITGKAIANNHSALPDAIALVEILYYTGLNKIAGPIYLGHCTSLQVIKWLGPACEKNLFDRDIRSLEQLISNVVAGYSIQNLGRNLDIQEFVFEYITQTCGITSGNSRSISDSIVTKWLPSAVKQV